MKTKICKYLFSAVLMGIAMLMTACVAKDDNVAAAGDPDNIEDFDMPEQAPTTDALAVPIDGTTYVFDANYTGEGKALVDRVKDRASWLAESETTPPNESVENIILHNDRIGHLRNGEAGFNHHGDEQRRFYRGG